ncbi:MAG: helix-turn-helix domain-containing protein [Planctomycetes bacterium]|nr:helix-turn-helix domain-containing protein [Planctomycetota bacterium]
MRNRDKLLQHFGQRVREARVACGVTQEQLAEHAGFDRTYISLVERGKRNLSLLNVCQLANALGKSAEDLVRGL